MHATNTGIKFSRTHFDILAYAMTHRGKVTGLVHRSTYFLVEYAYLSSVRPTNNSMETSHYRKVDNLSARVKKFPAF
jgi:hypothetical protein